MNIVLRILHIADSHIGADLPVRGDGKYRRRGSDFVDSFRRVLARAHELHADIVIHAGDLFDRSHPSDGAIAAATEPLWQLAQAGIPVVIVPGNHERSALPAALLLSHTNIHVLRTPHTVVIKRQGLRVAIAGFPCLRHTAAADFAATLEQTAWRQVSADVNILAVHQTFAGARCGPGNYQFRSGDDVVARELIPPGFHYIAAGHIHRHQVLPAPGPAGPPLVYAGSPDRIAFAELGEPKGGVLVEFPAGQAQPRFIEHAVRPMQILPFDVTGLSGPELRQRVLDAIHAAPPEAVVQVRLSGQATRRALAGLQMTARIRAARPDLTATISSQGVEWVTDRAAFRVASQINRSAFEVLDAPPTPIVSVGLTDLGTLPKTCGTYALYDAASRLLYVGKALNLRTRVRSHLRASSRSNHFRGWTQQIARAEVRLASSELEALLVEAELVRRLAPPFNRQMRLWKRYCYLCASDERYNQLAVASDPCSRLAFGPLRGRAHAEAVVEALSNYFGLARCPDDDEPPVRALPLISPAQLCRRYFAGACSGPCGGRIDAATYAARVRARDALLAGCQTEDVARIRQEAEKVTPTGGLFGTGPTDHARLLSTMADLCRIAAEFREARALLGALLLLPGPQGARTVAVVTPKGLHIEHLAPKTSDAQRILAWYRDRMPPLRPVAVLALPKPVADGLCTAVQQRRRRPNSSAIVFSQHVTRLSTAALHRLVFGVSQPPPVAGLVAPALRT